MATYYVSNTASNGIPVGSDATGDGTAAHPWFTLDKANASIAGGDTVYINDGVYTPTAGSLRITTSSTWLGVTDYGATIAAAPGQSRVIGIANATGGTVDFGKINIDGQNQALSAIVISDEPVPVNLSLIGTRILNPTGYGIQGSNIATEANVTLQDVDFEATQALSMLYLPGLAAGNVFIDGGTVNISGQSASGYGGIARIIGVATGPTVTIQGVTSNITAAAGAGAHYGIRLWNIANSVIQNNTITVAGPDTSFIGEPISVAYDLSHPLDSSGGIIRYNKLANYAYGGAGHLILVGYDGDPGASLRNYANNFQIYGNVGDGNAQSQAATLHGVLVGWQSGATVHDNSMDFTAIAYVLKGMSGESTVYGNAAYDTTVKSFYQKGGQNVAFLDNTSYNQAGYSDRGLYVGDDGSGNPASGGSMIGNTVYAAGQANAFFTLEPGSTINSIAGNSYYAAGGNSSGWLYGNSKYTTLSSWQTAVESTASSDPTFNEGVGALLGVSSVSGPKLVDEGIVNGVETFEILFDRSHAATATFALTNLGRASAAALNLQVNATSGGGTITSPDLSGSGVSNGSLGPIAGGSSATLSISYDGLGTLNGQTVHVSSSYDNTGAFNLVLVSAEGATPTLVGTATTTLTDKQTVQPFVGVTLTDSSPSAVETVTVRPDDPSAGQFVFYAGFGQNDDGSLSFTGAPAAATNALRSLVFRPTANRVVPGQATTTNFTIAVDDGNTAIVDDTTRLVVTSVNDPATVRMNPTPQQLTDLQTISPFATATITDPDGNLQSETVVVALDKASRGSFGTGTGFINNQDGTYTFVGTADAAQAALQGLVFTPAMDQSAAGVPITSKITTTVTDGLSPVSTGISYLIITTANKAPVVSPGVVTAITDKQTVGPFRSMTVTDTNKGAVETVTVTPSDPSAGQFTTLAGFTTNADGSISITGSPGSGTSALHGLVFTPAQNLTLPGQSTSVGFTVSANDGALTATDAATTLVVTSVNDAPTVTIGNPTQAITDHQTISPFATASVSDPDSGQIETVTITSNNPARGTFTQLAGFTDNGNGTYTFSGTAAAASNALYNLVFTPTAGAIGIGKTGTLKLTLAASDGISPPQSAAVNMTITGVAAPPNTPPAISSGTASAISDVQTVQPFAAMTVTDPDANSVESVTVASSDPTAGTFTNLNGFTAHPDGSISIQGTPSQVTAALEALVFTPTRNQAAPGASGTVTFTVTANDGAAVTTDSATQVTVTSVNDPPVIVIGAPPAPITEAQTVTPFAGVRIIDRDVGASETVTVALSDPGAGTFSNLGSFTAGPGGLTMTGAPRDVALALRGLVFTPTQHVTAPGQTTTTTLSLTVSDGAAIATDSSTQVAVTALDTPPSVALGAIPSSVSDEGSAALFANTVVSDPDVGAVVTATLALDQVGRGSFGTLSGFTDNGDGTYSFTGSPAALTSALQHLVFTPTPHQTAVGGSVVGEVTLTISDGLAPPTVATQDLTILALADNAPTISPGTSRAISDKQAASPFALMTIYDSDAKNSVTVTITPNDATLGTFTTLSGFTDNGDGSVSLAGSPAAVTAAIRGLVFTPAQNLAAPGTSRTVVFTVAANDGTANSTDRSSQLVITSVNDAPSLSLGATSQSLTDEATVAPFASASVADPDTGQSETVTVTLDRASRGGFTNLSGFVDNGDGSYTFVGGAADATAALRGLVFDPAEHQSALGTPVTGRVTVTVSDGLAPAVTSSESLTITATADNPPVLSAGTTTATTDKVSVMPFARMTLTDPDTQTETVIIVPTDPTLGSFTTLAGFTQNQDGSVQISGTASRVTAALEALVYTPTPNVAPAGSSVNAGFAVIASDGALSITDTGTVVTISALNDPPTLLLPTGTLSVNDDQTVQPFLGASVADPDPGQSETVTVTLDKVNRGSFTTLAGFADLGGGSYGMTGSAADVTAALNQLVFTPALHPTALGGSLNAKFTVSVSDGIAPAVTGSEYLTIVAHADTPPAITGATTTSIAESATATPFKTVFISDPDAGQVQTVTVSASSAVIGSLRAAGGFTANQDGSLTMTGTPSQVTSALHALTFVPNRNVIASGESGTVTFSITASDGLVATTDTGTQVVVNSVNDPPVITLASATQGITDQQTVSPFAGAVVSDPDLGAMETATITFDKLTRGSLSTTSGFTARSDGSYGFTGTPSALTAALNGLVFTPAPYQGALGSAVSAKLTLTVSDGIAAAVTATDRINITATADAPPVITAGKTLSLTDKKTTAPFKSMSITDKNAGDTQTVTVRMDNPANGTFTGTSAFTVGQDGSLTTVGAAAKVTSALHALTFVPTPNQALPGQTTTTSFTVTTSDGTLTATDAATKTVVTSVNDAPVITLASTAQSITDQQTINPFAGAVIADADGRQNETVTITLDKVSRGTFSTLAGFTDNHNGSFSFVGTAADASAAVNALAFTPAQHQSPAGSGITAKLTMAVSDGIASTVTKVDYLTINAPAASIRMIDPSALQMLYPTI